MLNMVHCKMVINKLTTFVHETSFHDSFFSDICITSKRSFIMTPKR